MDEFGVLHLPTRFPSRHPTDCVIPVEVGPQNTDESHSRDEHWTITEEIRNTVKLYLP